MFEFVLRGELSGDGVQNLEHAWNTARSILAGRMLVVDISGKTLVHPGIKLLHVPGEALRVAERRVTEPRSHVASKVEEAVRGIRQLDRQRYVVFQSLAY